MEPVVLRRAFLEALAAGQVADGRNGFGNQKPRTIGSSASQLMRKIDGSHHETAVTPGQWRTIWLWLESGAPYAGTYAALRNAEEQARESSLQAAFASPVLDQRCRSCHAQGKQAPPLPLGMSEQERAELVKTLRLAPYERIVRKEDLRYSAHVLLNVSRPECSPLLLGPLETLGDQGLHRVGGPVHGSAATCARDTRTGLPPTSIVETT